MDVTRPTFPGFDIFFIYGCEEVYGMNVKIASNMGVLVFLSASHPFFPPGENSYRQAALH